MAIFGVLSEWGNNDLCERKIMGAGNFGPSMNKISGAKFKTYNLFEMFSTIYPTKSAFENILPCMN